MGYIDVLLIGGSADGEWRRVDGAPSLDVVIFPKLEAHISQMARPDEAVAYERERYCRHTLRGPSGDYTVYVAGGDIDPIALLIDGYRNPK